jgi:hypothetical protein
MIKKLIIILISMTLLFGISLVNSERNLEEFYEENHNDQFNLYSEFYIVDSNCSTNNIIYPLGGSSNFKNRYDYVIITENNLNDAIISSSFIPWKESLGYNIYIVNISDLSIQDQQAPDLPGKIRNFLRTYYDMWGIDYVLIVGDHLTIPMRYCYPDPENHVFDIYSWSNGGEVPTDYYYADLSLPDNESWDSDGDGYYGEYHEDLPDFKAEVYIGRIPTSNRSEITYTLDKIVRYEQDTSDWKKQALHAGSILFYKYENYRYEIDHDIDGATCLNEIESNIMRNWTINHFSEWEGLSPSKYQWNQLTEPSFTEAWRHGKYGVVNWAGHGSSTGVGRTIWNWDNGNGIPEHAGNEIIGKPQINIYSQLDDDYPSVVFAVSCLVGYPEPTGYGNMGIDMLVKKDFGAAVAICSATRPAAISKSFPESHSGAEALCYEFNHYMINGPFGPVPIGPALYESKYFVHKNYGWNDWFYEYQNMYNYNLYGDPSMWQNIELYNPLLKINIILPKNSIHFNSMPLIPFFTPVMIGDTLIQTNVSENIQNVDFFIDDVLIHSDSDEPFEWMWEEQAFFQHKITVIGYDILGNHIKDETIIWKFF